MLWGLVATPLVMAAVTPWLPRCPPWTPVVAGAAVALLSAAVEARFAGDPTLAAWWWLAVVGTLLALIDSLHHRLPHLWTVSLLGGGLVVFTLVRPEALGRLVLASAAVFGLGLLVRQVVRGEVVGFGDTMLLTALAPYWAWHGWSTVLAGWVSAQLVLGGFAALGWLAGLRGPDARIAAGPGLVLGAWLALL